MSQRDDYVRELKARLGEWNAKLDELEARALRAGGEARIEYESQSRSLHRKRDAARERVEGLQEAADDAWQGLKEGVERARADLETGIERATSAFK